MKKYLPYTFALVGLGLLAYVFNAPLQNGIGKISANYIQENPKVIEVALKNLQSQMQADEQKKMQGMIQENRAELFKTDNLIPVIGNKNGSVEMVVFADPFCGHCRQFKKTIDDVVKQVPNLKVIERHVAIMSPKSELLIRAMLGSQFQNKYTQIHDAMYQTDASVTENDILATATAVDMNADQLKKDMARPEITAMIKANLDLAQKIGVQGTPTIIIHDQFIPGAVDAETLKKLASGA